MSQLYFFMKQQLQDVAERAYADQDASVLKFLYDIEKSFYSNVCANGYAILKSSLKWKSTDDWSLDLMLDQFFEFLIRTEQARDAQEWYKENNAGGYADWIGKIINDQCSS